MIEIDIHIKAPSLFEALKALDVVLSEVEEYGNTPLTFSGSTKDAVLSLRVKHDHSYLTGLKHFIDSDSSTFKALKRDK
jgi:hypothetical protein